jgi:hypothetical protein
MLRTLKESAARGTTNGLALAFALALAVFSLASSVSFLIVGVLAQHVRGNQLSFNFAGTKFVVDRLLADGLAVVFLVLAFWGMWRVEARALRTCPECKSRIPSEASVCSYCSSDIG